MPAYARAPREICRGEFVGGAPGQQTCANRAEPVTPVAAGRVGPRPRPASCRLVLTIIIVLQKSRVMRALDVGELELERVRAEVQAWFDARAWLLEHDAPRPGEARPHAQVRELPAGALGSLRWDVRGPVDHGCAATGWILPGEARLIDERARVQRLPPEQVDAMGIRRVLGEATAHRRRRRAG